MLMPSRYNDAIMKDRLKWVIQFLIKGEYEVELSSDYEKLSIQTSLEIPVYKCYKIIEGNIYNENSADIYIFDDPGKFRVIYDDNGITVDKIL